MADIDTSVYEPLAQASADRLVTFLHSLLLRAKGIREKSIMKALRLVHDQGEAFQTAFYAPPAPLDAPSQTKLIDNQVDVIMGTISQRILDWGQLPEKHADPAEVQRVHDTLFPLGLGILKLPFRKQWAHCDRMFKTLESEKLEKQVTAWVGQPFLEWARDRMAAYGKALKITSAEILAEPTTDEATLNDLMLSTRRAVTTYIRTCISQYEIGNLPAEQLVHALAPVLELRAEAAARPKKDEAKKKGDESPEPKPSPGPLPVVDDET